MIGFLKSFFSGEKSAEEQALAAVHKKHDVLVLDAYAMDDEEEEKGGGCGSGGCCGGCGGG